MELPEAEVIASELDARLDGKVIGRIAARPPFTEERLDVRKLRRDCRGKTIMSFHRCGKAVVAELSGARAILFQLGMTGALLIQSRDEPPEPHERLSFAVAGSSLRFVDIRRFGRIESFRRGEHMQLPRYMAALGPDAVDGGFDAEYLFDGTRGRKRSVKMLLMDSHFVAGIGNIYVSEILFRARVRPGRAAGGLSRAECGAIVRQTRAILYQAIRAGGTTISDYRNADGEPGGFARLLRVYGRTDQPCTACRTPIKRIVQSGRSSWYCPVCQS